MPSPHNSVSVLSRSRGQSAVAAAAYRHATQMRVSRDELSRDYGDKRSELKHAEIALPGAAAWAVEAFGEAAFYRALEEVRDEAGLEKLYTYAAWLSRLLPNREIPAEIEITEDMLRLQAFRVEQKEKGTASLGPGDTEALTPISEFAAKPYTEEEERSLSEIIKAFNDLHGTAFTREDFLRFEQVNREIMDDDLTEMLRNNPPDVVFSAFSDAFFKGAIKMFQRDNEMKSIVLSDAQARDRATRHFFNRALREVREGSEA